MKAITWLARIRKNANRMLQSLSTFLTRWRLLPAGLMFRWQLARLFAKQDATRRLYTRYYDEAKREKRNKDELEQLVAEAMMEESLIVDDIELLVSRFWLRRAQRLFVPTPDRKDAEMWKECRYTHTRVLTDKGITCLRKAVREEETAARDSWAHIAALLIGAVGAITGLIAVILTK